MAVKTLKMSDKLDLNYSVEGQASDVGVVYQMTENSKAYGQFDAATGLVTPLKPGMIHVDVLDAATMQKIGVVFVEIESNEEAEFRAQVEAGTIRHVRDFEIIPSGNAPIETVNNISGIGVTVGADFVDISWTSSDAGSHEYKVEIPGLLVRQATSSGTSHTMRLEAMYVPSFYEPRNIAVSDVGYLPSLAILNYTPADVPPVLSGINLLPPVWDTVNDRWIINMQVQGGLKAGDVVRFRGDALAETTVTASAANETAGYLVVTAVLAPDVTETFYATATRGSATSNEVSTTIGAPPAVSAVEPPAIVLDTPVWDGAEWDYRLHVVASLQVGDVLHVRQDFGVGFTYTVLTPASFVDLTVSLPPEVAATAWVYIERSGLHSAEVNTSVTTARNPDLPPLPAEPTALAAAWTGNNTDGYVFTIDWGHDGQNVTDFLVEVYDPFQVRNIVSGTVLAAERSVSLAAIAPYPRNGDPIKARVTARGTGGNTLAEREYVFLVTGTSTPGNTTVQWQNIDTTVPLGDATGGTGMVLLVQPGDLAFDVPRSANGETVVTLAPGEYTFSMRTYRIDAQGVTYESANMATETEAIPAVSNLVILNPQVYVDPNLVAPVLSLQGEGLDGAISTQPPTIQEIEAQQTYADFSFTSVPGVSGYEYRVGGGAWAPAVSPIRLIRAAGTEVTVEVRSCNTIGGRSVPAQFTYVFPPLVSAPTAGWNFVYAQTSEFTDVDGTHSLKEYYGDLVIIDDPKYQYFFWTWNMGWGTGHPEIVPPSYPTKQLGFRHPQTGGGEIDGGPQVVGSGFEATVWGMDQLGRWSLPTPYTDPSNAANGGYHATIATCPRSTI